MFAYTGDEIKLTCWFSSADEARQRNRTIYWGEGVEVTLLPVSSMLLIANYFVAIWSNLFNKATTPTLDHDA